jgi:hypothetical protein
MVLSFARPDPQYIAYIDEAGDPGLSRIHPLDNSGSTEWLVLAALVIRARREQYLTNWVHDIRTAIRSKQGPSLHYRTLSPDRKATVCRMLARGPIKAFVLLSNKKNMKGYKNERVEAARGASTQEKFYNWCVRLLLERVTDFVKEESIREFDTPKHLKIVFSERGGMRYSQTIAYLDLIRNQAQAGQTFLATREVKWEVLNSSLMSAVPHQRSPGAQLVDPIASAFFQATNLSGQGSWDDTYAKLLQTRMWERNGRYEDCGVSLQPKPYSRGQLQERQKQIFRFYGLRM